jgi:hypothetical protein
MSVSTSIPATVEIRRGHLIGLIVAAAALTAAITWMLVAVAFDPGATRAQQTVLRPGATPPATVARTDYPPDYRGMP